MHLLSGGMRSRVRTAIERNPAVAVSYRTIRDELAWRKQEAVETPFNFRFVGDASMQSGTFEPEETELMRNYLSNADVFVDIGANIGFYTCLARSMSKAVVSVEPLNQNLRSLYRNLIENGWDDVEVWPLGLAEKSGIMTIYGGGTGASLLEGWAGFSSAYNQTISVFTLDMLLGSRFDGKRMVIKVDVEGAEYGVLGGAQNTIRRSPKPAWLVEITLDINRPDVNPRFTETFEMFWSNGYEARTGDRQQRLITKADVDQWVRDGHCEQYNWLFVPEK